MSMFCYYKQFLMAKATTRFFMIAPGMCWFGNQWLVHLSSLEVNARQMLFIVGQAKAN